VVFAPFHWGGGSSANALTDPALDPVSRMPAFKVCAVAVTRVAGPVELLPAPDAATQPEPRPHEQPAARTPLPPSRPVPRRTPRVKSTPRFLQGVYPITGEGLDKPGPIDPALRYTVPSGATAQALYFRGGNSTEHLVYVLLVRDGVPARWFPIGAKGDVHVPLRVVEDLPGGTVVELQAAAPIGVTGELVVDLGLVEV
jgi:assimilatory nitrate reductase catalytic subunit